MEEIRREARAVAAASPPNGRTGVMGPKRTAPLFRDFVEGPWKEAHFDRYKPSTQEGRAYSLRNRLLPTFGPKPLDRISFRGRQALVRYIQSNLPGRSQSRP